MHSRSRHLSLFTNPPRQPSPETGFPPWFPRSRRPYPEPSVFVDRPRPRECGGTSGQRATLYVWVGRIDRSTSAAELKIGGTPSPRRSRCRVSTPLGWGCLLWVESGGSGKTTRIPLLWIGGR